MTHTHSALTLKTEVTSLLVALRQLDAAVEFNADFKHLQKYDFSLLLKILTRVCDKKSQFVSESLIKRLTQFVNIRVEEKSRLYADVALSDPPPAAITRFREIACLLPAHENMAPPIPLLAGGYFQFSSNFVVVFLKYLHRNVSELQPLPAESKY